MFFVLGNRMPMKDVAERLGLYYERLRNLYEVMDEEDDDTADGLGFVSPNESETEKKKEKQKGKEKKKKQKKLDDRKKYDALGDEGENSLPPNQTYEGISLEQAAASSASLGIYHEHQEQNNANNVISQQTYVELALDSNSAK